MSTYAVRAFRWQYLLAPIGPTHFSTAFRTTVIGFAAAFCYRPGRRSAFGLTCSRAVKTSATAAFATIILERLLDLVTVLLLFAGVRPDRRRRRRRAIPALFARVKIGGLVAAAPSLAGWRCSSCWRVIRSAGATGPAASSVCCRRGWPRRRALCRDVLAGAGGDAAARRLLVALVLSVPLWLSIAPGIWLTSQAFHITFPFRASFLVMTILVVGVAVPTPGAGWRLSLAYQIAPWTSSACRRTAAVGAAIVLHAISFVPVTLLGTLLHGARGLTLSARANG